MTLVQRALAVLRNLRGPSLADLDDTKLLLIAEDGSLGPKLRREAAEVLLARHPEQHPRPHRAIAHTWRELLAAVRKARADGADLVVRTIVTPPPSGPWSPPPPTPDAKAEARRAEHAALMATLMAEQARDAADEFGVRRMSLEALRYRAGEYGIAAAERGAIEAEIKRRDRPLSAAEHERLSRQHSALHDELRSPFAAQIDELSLTRTH